MSSRNIAVVQSMPTVLVVEDNAMIADCLEEMLTEAGYSVCGIARTVAQAVKLGNAHCPDLAVMDVNLIGGEISTAIVPLLTECGRVGILYATGNDSIVLTRADGDVCVRKPYLASEILGALQMVQQIIAGEAISSSAPTGARVLS
jgi:DNA-binding response OmpR family regulator